MTTTALIPPTEASTFEISLTLKDGHAFTVEFDDDALEPLQTDEPPPLGENTGPSPSRLLAAAVANCLASSLLHCVRKARVQVESMVAKVVATIGRNDHGRLRIDGLHVLLDVKAAKDQRDRLTRCVELFQDYCIVAESVKRGIDVRVSVSTT
ncbi:MAG: OsmC family protein [Gemmatimonadaceae bacterium]